MKELLISLTFCVIANFGFTQSNKSSFFSNTALIHTYKQSQKWDYTAEVDFKHYYSPSGWNRAGVNLTNRRKLGAWAVDLGFLGNFTYDKEIENYYEFRPTLAINLKNDVIDQMQFKQRVKFEWRNLVFTNGSEPNISTRVRYRITPTYEFQNKKNDRNWSTKADLEWYFISDQDLGERFNSTREFSLTVSKKLTEKYLLSVGYTHETFNENFNPDKIGGNTLNIDFTF